ncbi:ribosomal protein S10 domain-containing protein [Xylariales sp. PMI_506]|nr:ribosomal protein S10 domain-containing protein [Xylariales sp. PMI_506]
MAKQRIINPLRQAIARPLAQSPRNALPISVSRRSMADIATPKPSPAKASSASQLPPPLVMQPLINELTGSTEKAVRLPRSVQALYLQPLRREAKYGVPSCNLQLRSYSIPNLEFFCDFALRAAYYLNLPAFGPVPLPKMIERWTVPKGHFIDKKSQENFERITRRRLIQIRDGHPETVQIWLAFLKKHAYYGIGMKANVWEYSSVDVGKQLDSDAKSMEKIVEEKMMEHLGRDKTMGTILKVQELLENERFNAQK